MADKENKPPQTTAPVEDGWAAARRRLMEGQIWYQPLSSVPKNNSNVWKRRSN